MSLVIAKLAVPDFVESAWLVAVTCTVAGDGRSAGAVYTPADVITPTVAFPPGTPLTLQLTVVSDVFVTVAVRVVWFPSSTDAFVGVTFTVIAGGGGGGGGDAPPAPQPSVHAPSARTAMATVVVVQDFLALLCERDRMPSQKQAKGQRKAKEKALGIKLQSRGNHRQQITLNQHLAGAFEPTDSVYFQIPNDSKRAALVGILPDLELDRQSAVSNRE
jgi:hypothetical protein